MTKDQLIKILESIPETDITLLINSVGNLMVLNRNSYIGYICFTQHKFVREEI